MKNKFIKITFVSILCLIFIAGCSVVPSSTPEITPTPTPYDVIDIEVGNLGGSSANWDILEKALLEVVSLKATYKAYSDKNNDLFIAGMSNVYDDIPKAQDYVNHYNKLGMDFGCIDWRDYLDSMPNYLSRFRDKDDFYAHFYLREGTDKHLSYENASDGKIYVLPQVREKMGTICPIWMYNEAWFNKYNYDIPENMEELVDLLILHKQAYPDTTPILAPQSTELEFNVTYRTIEDGIAAAYGVDLSFYKDYITGAEIKLSANRLAESLKYENGKMELNSLNKNYIKALDMIKKVQDNALASAPSYSNVTQTVTNTDDFAVTYVWYEPLTIGRYYPDGFMLEENWTVFKNQLTMTETVNVNTSNGYNRVMGNFPITFLVKDQSDALGGEIERRLVEFVDWCASDEGILTLKYGFEGEHYTLDENGKVDNEKFNKDAFFDITVNYGGSSVSEANQFLKEPSEEYKVLVKIEKAFEGKNINLIINPNANLMNNVFKEDKQFVEDATKIMGKIRDFYKDYMSGAKTADDYTAYVAELEGLGLNDFLAQIEGIYERAYESGKFIPDSLK